ncbi:MAG: 2-dehydro-3-deoxygalactonokinase [Rhodanobacteraceae bacterium]|nr:MAG: 2-dehydro-3-deoxygalactonokinase [Rhodanobacteraceae bacterium]
MDWGTSSLRAYLFDADGCVQETRTRPWGIRQLPSGGFEAALADVCAGWPDCTIVAAGMVGSRQGWREAPYVDVPADLGKIAGNLTPIRSAGGRGISIVPGVRDPAKPDVMRGEETQILGALAQHPELATAGQLILPGTHSKWVDVRGGCIASFSTMMTGELYATLLDHSILGVGASMAYTTDMHGDAFDDGVRAAHASGNAGALTKLFSTRARVLESRMDTAAVPDYLSGLLIGEEWRSMLASGWLHAGRPPALVGDAALCARYRRAAALFDLALQPTITAASARGLWRILEAVRNSKPSDALLQPEQS